MSIAWGTYDEIAVAVELMKMFVGEEALARILDVVDAERRAVSQRLNRAQHGEGLLEWILEDQCDLEENLIGVGFVACQSRLTAIVAAVSRICRKLTTDRRARLPFDSENKKTKREILAYDQVLGTTGYSRVVLINSVANYYKHRDEWNRRDWAGLDSRSADTVKAIAAIGLESNSTANMRAAAIAFGWDMTHEGGHPLQSPIDAWVVGLIDELKKN